MECQRLTPKVSVIIPVYNAMPYLARCIDDVLSQTMHEIEIICVDDGSTDDSLNVLQAYAKRDERIRIFTQQNKFAGAARNRGIDEARGEYLMFLDADDLFEPQLVEMLYTACERDMAQMALCRSDIFDMLHNTYKKNNPLARELFPVKIPFAPAEYADYLFQFVTPAPWGKIFRRDLIMDGGIRFECRKSTNDLYFSFCNAAIAQSVTFTDNVLVHLRRGHTTNIQSRNDKYLFDCSNALLSVKHELQARGLFSIFERSFVSSAVLQSHYVLNTLSGNPAAYSEFLLALRESLFEQLEVLHHPKEFYLSSVVYSALQWMLCPAANFSKHLGLKKIFFIISCSIKAYGLTGTIKTGIQFIKKRLGD